jgi:hypothetical protein
MNTLSKIVSAAALLVLLLLPLLHFGGLVSLPQTKAGLLIMTLFWFASATLWMGRLKADN